TALSPRCHPLEKYRDIDEDKILQELSPEELAQLDAELAEMDPENVLLPAGLRQRDQTHKSPTGPLDREALLQHLERQALEAEERQDLVPFTGEKKGLGQRGQRGDSAGMAWGHPGDTQGTGPPGSGIFSSASPAARVSWASWAPASPGHGHQPWQCHPQGQQCQPRMVTTQGQQCQPH
uniref:Tropomodulin 4 n=1 Tax=Taeniopygia guttata TaxID=59729 RepID=A0A674HA07_TAEGU